MKRTAMLLTMLITAFTLNGCSNSPEEQFRIACNTKSYLKTENYKFEGKITGIEVGKSGGRVVSGFDLICDGGGSFRFVWIGGDLSKEKNYSTAVVTLKKGEVTDVDVSSDGFLSILWLAIKIVFFMIIGWVILLGILGALNQNKGK